MSQAQYINRLLKKINMEDCKPKQTVCDINVNKLLDQTCETDKKTESMKIERYREIVGSLIYIVTATRPDLCFIATTLSRYLSMPDDTHMVIAKHVLRYLKATIFERLTFR